RTKMESAFVCHTDSRVSVLKFVETFHPIALTLGGCIAEEPRKCSVECEVVRMSGSRETLETGQSAEQALNQFCERQSVLCSFHVSQRWRNNL
ncbi:hypothetical protein NQZ68_023072, partial [Dissostichus eleginoides]